MNTTDSWIIYADTRVVGSYYGQKKPSMIQAGNYERIRVVGVEPLLEEIKQIEREQYQEGLRCDDFRDALDLVRGLIEEEEVMEEKNEALFKLLVAQTQILCVVVDNAAENLSDDFKDMVIQPLAAVRDVLKDCPTASVWDGSFREDDIIVSEYRHESQTAGPTLGIMIRHIPTDLSAHSYSKRTRMDNELVCRRALADMVQRKWEREQAAVKRAEAAPQRRSRSRSVT